MDVPGQGMQKIGAEVRGSSGPQSRPGGQALMAELEGLSPTPDWSRSRGAGTLPWAQRKTPATSFSRSPSSLPSAC